MLISELCQTLDTLFPFELREDWDVKHPLQVGDPNATIKKVLVSLDCRDDVIDECIDGGLNVLITHHPLIFQPLASITPVKPVSNRVIRLIKHDINLISIHTPADSAVGGLNDFLGFTFGSL
ncbi:hypothetical protein GEMRC1_001638 [Eukaryota sp. GEM-RC1]